MLFEEVFEVKDMDPQGKKFDRVSRLICKSGTTDDVELIIDVNTQLYPLKLGDKFSMCLTRTLNLDGTMDDGSYDQSGKANVADNWDYVMHGIVYRIEEAGEGSMLSVYISFGGLLMRLKAESSLLRKPGLDLDSFQYLLIRK